METAPSPTSPLPLRNTLRCPGCRTPLALKLVGGLIEFLAPCTRDQLAGTTRVTCPQCGAVRVVSHR